MSLRMIPGSEIAKFWAWKVCIPNNEIVCWLRQSFSFLTLVVLIRFLMTGVNTLG